MPTAVRRCLPALLQPMKRGPQPHSTPPPRLSPSSTPHLALLPTLLISLLVAHRLQQPLSYDEEVEETGEMSGAAAGRSGGRSSSTPRPQRWTERRPLGWTPSLPSFLGSLGSVGCCAVLSAAQLLGRCCGASPASSTVQCQTPLEGVVPPHLRGWPHEGAAASVDCAGVRRGFEVYRQVCSACHSLQYLHYRQLVGVSHTEEQAKALARSVRVIDGPDEEGQMVERPASLADALPSPYPNEQFARSANNGALPPDLSLIVSVDAHSHTRTRSQPLTANSTAAAVAAAATAAAYRRCQMSALTHYPSLPFLRARHVGEVRGDEATRTMCLPSSQRTTTLPTACS